MVFFSPVSPLVGGSVVDLLKTAFLRRRKEPATERDTGSTPGSETDGSVVKTASDSVEAVDQALAVERIDELKHEVAETTAAIEDQLAVERTAQLKLYARTQYGFYVCFQLLVLVLAIVAAGALVIGIVRLVFGDPSNIDVVISVIVAIGAVATGGAAVFIQRQATEGKDRYLEAIKLIDEAR
ncbi:hypothetical protein [Rhodococcus tukisamuensis]|uniref:hypothetical protein n=1 Tax=Rhodococcus tukisamuensis TaxID=168276 RepID=UPI000932CE1F|nr:hypothetical protein [Rhodococcus tukisamuensis]